MVDIADAIRLDGSSGEPYKNRGLYYFVIKNWAKAETDLQTAIRLSPQDGVSFFHYGRVLDAQGDIIKSHAHLRRACFLGCGSMLLPHISLFDAMPFLKRELLTKYMSVNDIKRYFQLYGDLDNTCEAWDLYLHSLSLDPSITSRKEWYTFQAVVQFYMGHPAAAFQTLRLAAGKGHKLDLRDWYYVILSAQSFLEPPFGLEDSKHLLAVTGEKDTTDHHYALRLRQMLADQPHNTPRSTLNKPLFTPVYIDKDIPFDHVWAQISSRLSLYESLSDPMPFARLLEFHPSFLDALRITDTVQEYKSIEEGLISEIQKNLQFIDRYNIDEAIAGNEDIKTFLANIEKDSTAPG